MKKGRPKNFEKAAYDVMWEMEDTNGDVYDLLSGRSHIFHFYFSKALDNYDSDSDLDRGKFRASHHYYTVQSRLYESLQAWQLMWRH